MACNGDAERKLENFGNYASFRSEAAKKWGVACLLAASCPCLVLPSLLNHFFVPEGHPECRWQERVNATAVHRK